VDDAISTLRSGPVIPLPIGGSYRRELETAVEAVIAAGQEILRIYQGASFGEYAKVDGSPVTDADLAADRVIRSVIQGAFPSDPLLTEEGQDNLSRILASRCWIVDPIDGTEQFIRRTGEFDILVAFVEEGRPVAVAGYQPTTSTLVIAGKDQGAWISVGGHELSRLNYANDSGPIRIASSKWFGAPDNAPLIEAIAKNLDSAEVHGASEVGFTPRMFLAPRSLDAMIGIRNEVVQDMASEWDFAVTDLVINEAGGVVTDLAGNPFQYNKPEPVNSGGLLASVTPEIHSRLVAAVQLVQSHSQS
jgi:3'-phosphoadenosine 5'-phosphosulfate (PAPS) 3'-phosphatase